MSVRLLFAVVIAAAAAAANAAPPTVERIDLETGDKAAQPSVAVLPDEGFIVTWQERDGDGHALRFAVVDRDGVERRRGLVSTGPARFVNGADFPSLAVLDNGDWVTHWLQKTATGTYAYEIRLTRSRDAGRTWEPARVIHRDATPTEHGFVSLVPDGDDRVRVVWLDGRRMAASADAHGEGADEEMTLRSAVIGRDGEPRDEHELDALTCACCQTDMVRGATVTVAAYRDRTSHELRDIGALVRADGRWSEPRIAHADGWKMAACPVNGPALAVDGDRFTLVWPTMARGEMEVRLASGVRGAFGAPFDLATGAGELGRVDVATWRDSHVLVTRVATVEGVPSLFVGEHEADGVPASRAQRVAGPVGGYPRIARSGDVALLAWTEPVEGKSG
ncbi:MAG TPA: hypothetical protein VND91_09230, partial [Candidatus Saccharimonadia bacterium]|nr:hypothetical protein [Candidatus Saccharimonadia bacterium]